MRNLEYNPFIQSPDNNAQKGYVIRGGGEIRFAIMTERATTNSIRVQFDDEADARQKAYKELDSGIENNVGDRVVLMPVAGTFLVLGRMK